ncbi:regulator of chromosome condensation 1/beta-lactamase-inhibitor protein II [Xylaria flabelliformis]|nr:regulator of chromosome condensation 1/beta-lactamase-inhibitor protein II [Xylaria flabelliformis]
MDGLFALGSNGSGQLGLGHKEDVSVPKQVQFSEVPQDDPITQVAAGGNHTVLITASGKAYWSGDPTNGCCGVVEDEDKGDISVFRKFCTPNSVDMGRIMHVTCTWDTTIFVTGDEDGRATRIYIYGATEGEGGPSGFVPDFPPVGTAVTSLAAGFRHIVVVLDNGDVYGWGNEKKGQLGQPEDGADASGIVTKPRKIEGIPFGVAKAVCCQYTTCLVAEPGDGRILVLGADKWKLKSQAPTEVSNWKVITASWGSIYILKRDGMIEAWGRDDHGQLPPPGIPEITHIVAGSEHVLALTATGDVLAWGWGEHGNCGPHTDEKFGDVKGRWNVLASLKNLSEGSSITAIGAGCATSWINITAEGLFL